MASLFRFCRMGISAGLIYWFLVRSGGWETLAMLSDKPQELQMVLSNYRPGW